MSNEPQLSATDLAAIDAEQHWRMHRTQAVQTSIGRVWVKGQREGGATFGHFILDAAARVLGLDSLRVAPAQGGARAQATEHRRLLQLRSAGVAVPQVLHQNHERLVLQMLSPRSLVDDIANASTAQDAFALWSQGAHALAQVHAQSQYLSQAFARNMIVHAGQVWFIDFEDDPLSVMPLEAAQARDALAFLHSTVWLMQGHGIDLLSKAELPAQVLRPELAKNLSKIVRRLGVLRRLPTKRRPWGRDVVTTQAAMQLLWRWEQQNI